MIIPCHNYIDNQVVDVCVTDIRVGPGSIMQDLVSQYVEGPDIAVDTVMSLQQTFWGRPTNRNSMKIQI